MDKIREMNDFPESLKKKTLTEEQMKSILNLFENQSKFVLDKSNEKKEDVPFDEINWLRIILK